MTQTFKLLVIALLSLATFPAPASSDDVIRIGIISTTFGYAPIFVVKEKRFSTRGSLSGVIVISRNEQILQSLISDLLQFDNVRPKLLFVMRQQGKDGIKLIHATANAI